MIGQEVRTSFFASDRVYGARRVWRDVRAAGHACGLHRIEWLMRANAFQARPKRRCRPVDTVDWSIKTLAPNVLDRQFSASTPNQTWVADFAFAWTAEGWLYVAVVLDLYARRVVGWSMHATMTAQLVTDALTRAVRRRGKHRALLHHSDRGSQYTSEAFQRTLHALA